MKSKFAFTVMLIIFATSISARTIYFELKDEIGTDSSLVLPEAIDVSYEATNNISLCLERPWPMTYDYSGPYLKGKKKLVKTKKISSDKAMITVAEGLGGLCNYTLKQMTFNIRINTLGITPIRRDYTFTTFFNMSNGELNNIVGCRYKTEELILEHLSDDERRRIPESQEYRLSHMGGFHLFDGVNLYCDSPENIEATSVYFPQQDEDGVVTIKLLK